MNQSMLSRGYECYSKHNRPCKFVSHIPQVMLSQRMLQLRFVEQALKVVEKMEMEGVNPDSMNIYLYFHCLCSDVDPSNMA